MREYLINIHRFYSYFYKNSFDAPIMPCMVAASTLSCFLMTADFILNNHIFFDYLKSIHEYAVAIPFLLSMFIFYLYYKDRLPNQEELSSKNGMWLGIIVSIFSMITALVASCISY